MRQLECLSDGANLRHCGVSELHIKKLLQAIHYAKLGAAVERQMTGLEMFTLQSRHGRHNDCNIHIGHTINLQQVLRLCSAPQLITSRSRPSKVSGKEGARQDGHQNLAVKDITYQIFQRTSKILTASQIRQLLQHFDLKPSGSLSLSKTQIFDEPMTHIPSNLFTSSRAGPRLPVKRPPHDTGLSVYEWIEAEAMLHHAIEFASKSPPTSPERFVVQSSLFLCARAL